MAMTLTRFHCWAALLVGKGLRIITPLQVPRKKLSDGTPASEPVRVQTQHRTTTAHL